MDHGESHRPPSGGGYDLRPGPDTVGIGRYTGRAFAGGASPVPLLDRDRDGVGRPGRDGVDHGAVRPDREGYAGAVGPAREAGRPRSLPPRAQSHEFGYAAHTRRRSPALRLMAPGRLDVRVLRGVCDLLPVLRGTGPRAPVR